MPRNEAMVVSDAPLIDLIRDTWPVFQSNLAVTVGVPAFLVAIPLIVVGIPTCIIALIAGVLTGFINKNLIIPVEMLIGLVALPLFALAYSYIRAGWTLITLRMNKGEMCHFSDWKNGRRWLINLTITMFLVGVGTTLFSLLLVIPGIFFAVRTSFAAFLVIDEDLAPLEAMKRSNDLITGYSWQILLYHGLYTFANIVLGIIPVIGMVLPLASMGFFDLALAKIYLYRTEQITDSEHPPEAAW
jgi:hypothetical protein